MFQFLLDYKIPKLKQFHKKESKTGPKNYRPVLLLLVISKIVEKVFRDQAKNILNKNQIEYKYHAGFHKSFLTNSYLLLV